MKVRLVNYLSDEIFVLNDHPALRITMATQITRTTKNISQLNSMYRHLQDIRQIIEGVIIENFNYLFGWRRKALNSSSSFVIED